MHGGEDFITSNWSMQRWITEDRRAGCAWVIHLDNTTDRGTEHPSLKFSMSQIDNHDYD